MSWPWESPRDYRRDPIGFIRQKAAQRVPSPDLPASASEPSTSFMKPPTQSKSSRKTPETTARSATKARIWTGAVASEGALWAKTRKLAMKAFTPEYMARYARTITGCMRSLFQTWEGKRAEQVPINLAPCMNHLAIGIIGKGLFGVNLESRAAELESSLQILLKGMSGVFKVPGTSVLLPTSTARPYVKAFQSVQEMVSISGEERRKR